MEINIGIIAIIVLAIAILAILASGYVKASPNKAYIISGIKREPKVLIGRAGIKIPFLEKKEADPEADQYRHQDQRLYTYQGFHRCGYRRCG